MTAALAPVFIFALVVTVFVGAWFYNRWRANNVLAELRAFETFRGGTRLFFGDIRAEFERGAYRCSVTSASSGGKNNRRTFWRVRVDDVRLGKRTSMRIGREDLMTRIASKVGMTDIQIGDADFDATYRIHGANELNVRGVLKVPEVQMGVSEAFAMMHLQGDIDLRSDGQLHLMPERWGLHAHAAEGVASLAFDLAELLDKHRKERADEPVVVPEMKNEVPALASVSGGSGAPVGFGSRGRK